MPWSSSLATLPAFPGDSNDLLERFLHDMEALDHQASVPSTSDPMNKRKLDDSIAQSPSDSKPLSKNNHNKKQPSWLKRKQELETLRQQTQAMETRVAYLEMKRTSPKLNGDSNSFELKKLKSTVLMERERCQAAQEENERLRAKLLFYRGQYEAFQMTMTAAEFQQKNLLRAVSGVLRMGQQHEQRVCSAQVFDMLEGRLDARLYELDHAFNVMQQPMSSTDTELVETRNDHRGLGAVEFTRLELLPFDEKDVSATMWSFIEAGKFPDGERPIVRWRSDDSFAQISTVTIQIDCGSIVQIASHCVVKRFMTSNGLAVMAESCSEWTINSPTSGTWNYTTREEGCFVLRNYSVDGGDSPGVCQSRFFLCIHPGEYAKKSKAYPLNEVVISSFRQLSNARHQFVENALFDTIRCGRQ